jgi:hypothetical protein
MLRMLRFPLVTPMAIWERLMTRYRHSTISLIATAVSFLCVPAVYADRPPAVPDVIVANPNRPTVANPADITQFGVVELEYGFAHAQVPLHQHQNTLEGLLKFAVACDLEIRWDASPFSNQGGPAGGQSGIGDNWLGFQYRFHRQSRFVPTLAFSYDLKFPSASVSKGLGTGRYDHQFVFLASKDIKGFHFDFNASLFRVGRQDGSGSDINEQFNLAFSHPIYKNLGFTGEFYGDTRLGRETPAFASGLWALTYAVSSRFVIDSGMDHGITSGGPHERRFFAGLTYSIADLYHHKQSSE